MTLKQTKEGTRAAGLTQPLRPILYVPHTILQDTASYFLPYSQAGVETACYWFGMEIDTSQIVTTLVIPRLYQAKRNYRINPVSSQRLAHEMSEQGLVNLAQVHTHPPDCGVEHSPYDDHAAYSTRTHALSFVWPDYGRSASHDLGNVGVHECRGGHWILLTASQVAERVRLLHSIVDYRWEIEQGDIEENNDTRKPVEETSR